jgi:hypothetical protein
MAKSTNSKKIMVNGNVPKTKSKVIKPYRTEQGMDLNSVVERHNKKKEKENKDVDPVAS